MYKVEYLEYNGTSYSTVEEFENFPNPSGNVILNLRSYLETKFDNDYLMSTSLSNGITNTYISKDFKIKVSETYAYQFPFVELDSLDAVIGTGVTQSSVKYNILYDTKLFYSKVGSSVITPIFDKGSIVEIIDETPTNNTNPKIGLLGQWTILDVGVNYVVINSTYDASRTYSNGSILWSDRRRVESVDTTYLSGTFSCINNQSLTKKISTNAPDNYELRPGSIINIPLNNLPIGGSIKIYKDTTLLNTYTYDKAFKHLTYNIPSLTSGLTSQTLYIRIYNSSDSLVEEKPFKIYEECEATIKKVELYFIDEAGSYMPYYFDMKNQKSIEVQNNTFLTYDKYGRTTKRQINQIKTIKYEINTKFMDELTSKYMEELFQSNHIYMRYENKALESVIDLEPVIIVEKSTQINTKNNKRLLSYKLTIEKSKKEYIHK
jgi:hypothetical protein